MTIILELTGKIKDISKEKKIKKTDEAEEGLVSLGFARQQAKDALAISSKDIKDTEERIKAALEVLGK